MVDVHEEWVALDQYKLSDESKTYVIKNILSDSIFVSDDTINDVEKKRENWIERGRMADKLRRQLAKNPDEAVRINDEILELLGDEEGVFDHVVSNPPYQIPTTASRNVSIWPEFLMSAVAIGKNVSMINPARWIKGGSGTGLTGIRDWIMENPRLTKYYTMRDTDAFPGTIIRGGVCIEVFIQDHRSGDMSIGKWDKENGWSEDTFVPVEGLDISLDPKDMNLVGRILGYTQNRGLYDVSPSMWVSGQSILTKKISPVVTGDKRSDYGFTTQRIYRDPNYFVSQESNVIGQSIKVFFIRNPDDPFRKSGKIGVKYLPFTEAQEGSTRDKILSYQVVIPKTEGKNLYRRLMPIAIHYETYAFSWMCKDFYTKEEAENFESYMKTYFYRYLVALRITSQHAFANVHRFVPDLEDVVNPRTGLTGYHSDWTDDDLRDLLKDHLTDDDWRYIKAEAVKADKGKGDYEAGWKFPDGSTHHSLSL